jgi:hypothetical protein
MKKILMTVTLLSLTALNAFASNEPKDILPLLRGAKMSLLDGIAYAEKLSGPATSAKFEVEDGKLNLSVYTVPGGLAQAPEAAALSEVSGNVLEAPFKASVEVFADKEHIARAAVHMTLLQQSPFSLSQIIGKALARVPGGSPIDVRNPMIRNKRPVADVVIADDDGDEAYTVSVDLLNGSTQLKK